MNVSEMLGSKAGLFDERLGGGIEGGEGHAQRWGRLRGDLEIEVSQAGTEDPRVKLGQEQCDAASEGVRV